MKMIASKNLTKIFLYLIAFASLIFASCSLGNTENVTSEFAILKISCDDSLSAARTIMPSTPQSLNAMSNFVLKGNKIGETEETIKTWSSYSQIASASLELLPGSWEFTLTAEYNGVSYTGTASETLVKNTSTTLSFTLAPPATGNGSISVTIKWPASNQVQKVTAGLYDSAGSAVGFDTNLTISGTSATYANNAAAAGNYLVKFNFYRDAAGSDKINTYVCAVQVVAGFDSTGTETVALLNNKYTLTLDANGGTFDASVDTTRTFTEYEYVDLPTDSDVSRAGYVLVGWYENAAGTGTEVKSWNVGGMKRNLTLYAKWEIVSEIYLDGASGSDSNDGATATTAVATLANALTKLNFTATSPKIIIVNPYTLASGEKLEIATGKLTIERYSGCAGSLITVPAGDTLSLSGAVQILGDVYLASGATITIAGTLAPPDATKPVAEIILPSASYVENTQILAGTAITDALCEKFKLLTADGTKKSSEFIIKPNSTATQALLAKPQGGGGIVLIGDVTFTLKQGGAAVVTNGGSLTEGATLTFTATAKNSAGGEWTIPANAEYKIELRQHGTTIVTANTNSLTVPALAFLNDVYEVYMYIKMDAGEFADRVMNLTITE